MTLSQHIEQAQRERRELERDTERIRSLIAPPHRCDECAFCGKRHIVPQTTHWQVWRKVGLA